MLVGLKKRVAWLCSSVSSVGFGWRYYRLAFVLLLCDIVYSSFFLDADLTIAAASRYDGSVTFFSLDFFALFFLVALFEEVLFRILPLTVLLRVTKNPYWLLVGMIGTSILFGLSHGSVANIIWQGVGGFFYAIAFVKYAQGSRGIWEASIIVIMMHLLYNCFYALYLMSLGLEAFPY